MRYTARQLKTAKKRKSKLVLHGLSGFDENNYPYLLQSDSVRQRQREYNYRLSRAVEAAATRRLC